MAPPGILHFESTSDLLGHVEITANFCAGHRNRRGVGGGASRLACRGAASPAP